jgi:hypothetical protein
MRSTMGLTLSINKERTRVAMRGQFGSVRDGEFCQQHTFTAFCRRCRLLWGTP